MALSRYWINEIVMSHSQVCKAHCDQRTQLEAEVGILMLP